jgi:hypothetical protein
LSVEETGVRLIVELRRTMTGQLSGRISPEGSAACAVPFHGVLELVAALEARLDACPSDTRKEVSGVTGREEG